MAVVAREYDLPRKTVVALARCNDAAPAESRVAAVRDYLDGLL